MECFTQKFQSFWSFTNFARSPATDTWQGANGTSVIDLKTANIKSLPKTSGNTRWRALQE